MIVNTVPAIAGRIGPAEESFHVPVEVSTAAEPSVDQVEPSATAPAASVDSTAPPAESPTTVQETSASQPEAETQPAASSESTPAQPLSDELFWAQVGLLGELAKAEQHRSEVEESLADAEARRSTLRKELAELDSNIPEIKERLEGARDDSLRIARDLCVVIRDHRLPTPPESTAPEGSAQPASANAPAGGATATADQDGWRTLPTSELLSGIKGMGKTKLEAICDACPTVGDLEDLRRDGSQQHKQFREVLPKGVGQTIADAIEDRIGKHVCDYAKQLAAGTGQPDTTLADKLVADIRAIAAQEPWRPEDCQPDESDTDLTRAGFAAHGEGAPYTALPTRDPQLAHQWMVGWVSAEVIAAAAKPPVPQSKKQKSKSKSPAKK